MLAQRLASLFEERQYTWKIDGQLSVPSENDIQDVIDEAQNRLKTKPMGTWLEIGRLIFVKSPDNLDVYVLFESISTEPLL